MSIRPAVASVAALFLITLAGCGLGGEREYEARYGIVQDGTHHGASMTVALFPTGESSEGQFEYQARVILADVFSSPPLRKDLASVTINGVLLVEPAENPGWLQFPRPILLGIHDKVDIVLAFRGGHTTSVTLTVPEPLEDFSLVPELPRPGEKIRTVFTSHWEGPESALYQVSIRKYGPDDRSSVTEYSFRNQHEWMGGLSLFDRDGKAARVELAVSPTESAYIDDGERQHYVFVVSPVPAILDNFR